MKRTVADGACRPDDHGRARGLRPTRIATTAVTTKASTAITTNGARATTCSTRIGLAASRSIGMPVTCAGRRTVVEWRQVDGNYVLAAAATGIIASVIANRR